VFEACCPVTLNLLYKTGFPTKIFLHMKFDILIVIIGFVLNIIILRIIK